MITFGCVLTLLIFTLMICGYIGSWIKYGPRENGEHAIVAVMVFTMSLMVNTIMRVNQ